MKFQQLNSDLFVTKQISFEDIKRASNAGIKTLICNRVEGEENGQLELADISAEARKLDMETISIPVVAGQISDEDVTKFAEVLKACTKPALAYCRTGTRSTTLWALSQSGKLPFSEVLSTAKTAGYDLSQIKTRYVEPSNLHNIRSPLK